MWEGFLSACMCCVYRVTHVYTHHTHTHTTRDCLLSIYIYIEIIDSECALYSLGSCCPHNTPTQSIGGTVCIGSLSSKLHARRERESTPHTNTIHTHTHARTAMVGVWVGGWVGGGGGGSFFLPKLPSEMDGRNTHHHHHHIHIYIYIYIYIYIWMDGLIDAYLPILLLLL